jgi:hypothetical protein
METTMYAPHPIRDLARSRRAPGRLPAPIAIWHRIWLRADFLLLCGARSVTASPAAELAE